MPLKARLYTTTASKNADQVSTSEVFRELPGDEADDVLFNTLYGLRTVELNRPRKLNSLNGSMARKIILRLKEWEKSQMANVIIIKGAGDRAFCAGGDVAALVLQNIGGREGQQKSKDYFGLEYKLDHLIATYSKPFVAFMDGVTMGGGVGLSIHGSFRIATERTLFAMPECRIGFFPDVGASFFLPRLLDGAVGTYLALTSQRLEGADVFYAGLATHYIHSSSLADLETRLSELTFADHMNLAERIQIVDATIEEFTTGLPHDEPMGIGGAVRQAIDRCFQHNSIEKIVSALEAEVAAETPTSRWAQATLESLLERSPTSVRVTLRLLRLGVTWNIDEAFQREYVLAGKFMNHPDFTEGVTARLIKKPTTNPKWKPAVLADTDDAMVDEFFSLEGQERLPLLHHAKYMRHPYHHLTLPSEKSIEQVVREGGSSRIQVIKHFEDLRGGKMGVREKVSEVLKRKTTVKGNQCSWIDDGL